MPLALKLAAENNKKVIESNPLSAQAIQEAKKRMIAFCWKFGDFVSVGIYDIYSRENFGIDLKTVKKHPCFSADCKQGYMDAGGNWINLNEALEVAKAYGQPITSFHLIGGGIQSYRGDYQLAEKLVFLENKKVISRPPLSILR